jgi:sensor domain CHASE-containing protein
MKEVLIIGLIVVAILVSMGVVGNEEFLHSEYLKEDKTWILESELSYG